MFLYTDAPHARNHKFYGRVFNGERLYKRLRSGYTLLAGERKNSQICIETFPNAVVCALAGRIVPARPKVVARRKTLADRGYDVSSLTNIDFVDAALCAVAAYEYSHGRFQKFGCKKEGFIAIPETPRES